MHDEIDQLDMFNKQSPIPQTPLTLLLLPLAATRRW
jgi:hypothetical protein